MLRARAGPCHHWLFCFVGTIAAIVIGLFISAPSISAWDVKANSRTGRRLMRNAVKVELDESSLSTTGVVTARRIEEENGDDDESWIAYMSLKFEGCYNTVVLAAEEGGNYNNGINIPIENRGVVTFRLCSSYNCQHCSGGGIYAISLSEFVDSYTEARMEENEYKCEITRENCGCDYADDAETCAYDCWSNAGMGYCDYMGNGENGQVFEVQNYLQCNKMEVNDNNNNNNNNRNNGGEYYYSWRNNNNNGNDNNNYKSANNFVYNGYQIYPNWDGNFYVGPYCAEDGRSIFLGVFYDQGCAASAGDGAYATLNYAQLPYSANSRDGPLVPLDTCVYCTNKNNNGNGNNNNNNDGESSEFCATVWGDSVKCNTNDRSGCHYIKKVLPKLNSGGSYIRYVGAPNNNVPLVFASLFAVSTIVFGAYSFYLYRKIKLGEVDIYDDDDDNSEYSNRHSTFKPKNNLQNNGADAGMFDSQEGKPPLQVPAPTETTQQATPPGEQPLPETEPQQHEAEAVPQSDPATAVTTENKVV